MFQILAGIFEDVDSKGFAVIFKRKHAASAPFR